MCKSCRHMTLCTSTYTHTINQCLCVSACSDWLLPDVSRSDVPQNLSDWPNDFQRDDGKWRKCVGSMGSLMCSQKFWLVSNLIDMIGLQSSTMRTWSNPEASHQTTWQKVNHVTFLYSVAPMVLLVLDPLLSRVSELTLARCRNVALKDSKCRQEELWVCSLQEGLPRFRCCRVIAPQRQ